MIGVGFDDPNRSARWRGFLGPIDGIKEDGQLVAEVGGGPEFGFTGGVVGVPSGKT